ncbi:hypothetical protein PsYK624_092350 [Phanerochaete sordida]|uniref:Uncharacterized protein n=1 Tax=Phanerochaete sordida TaxID=48140 RepID=A0A9P3GE24_9APHY|nr:hypothetical protein PsYK624_092350 [Phanerochaete sordida]
MSAVCHSTHASLRQPLPLVRLFWWQVQVEHWRASRAVVTSMAETDQSSGLTGRFDASFFHVKTERDLVFCRHLIRGQSSR